MQAVLNLQLAVNIEQTSTPAAVDRLGARSAFVFMVAPATQRIVAFSRQTNLV